MGRVLLVSLLVAVVIPVSAGAAERPEVFMKRVLRYTVEARYGQAWQLLHPSHQRVAPRARFVGCREDDPALAPYRFVSASVASKRRARIDSPGIPQRTATRVVLRFRIADARQTYPAATATVNAVWTGKRWAWVLPAGEVPAFRAGRCPA